MLHIIFIEKLLAIFKIKKNIVELQNGLTQKLYY